MEQIAPHTSKRVANRIHRWLNHTEAKRVCQEFALPILRSPLRELLGDSVSVEMQVLATNFVKLQEARHKADYDLDFYLSWEEAREFIELAVNALGAWSRLERTAEANVFVLSLFLWKNWHNERG